MKTYNFTLELDYEFEAEDEAEAIGILVDMIKRDWQYYADEGAMEEVEK